MRWPIQALNADAAHVSAVRISLSASGATGLMTVAVDQQLASYVPRSVTGHWPPGYGAHPKRLRINKRPEM